MNYKQIEIGPVKKIALVAHDNKKQDLYEWAKFNRSNAGLSYSSKGTICCVWSPFLDVSLGAPKSGQRGE